MAKISLRMYNREIEGLVEQQRLEEAIAHCRHILKSYPKHLETYRMLGKAYLEAKRYDQAVDIFQRVLVAAPDDFVSHVGMSIIADDKGKLDDAIWHMERAFEVQPSNAAIQAELQRLFGRRDGVEPPKIRLTRGALAHMYVQGELYTQAISEIRAVLATDNKRTDMQTLLARAYYRNGQKAEATEICNELIGRYQYCLDANRLMAEILPGAQHADAAQQYRDRVVELDPYAAFAQDSLFRTDAVPDNAVTIEHLEYTAEMAEMPPALGLGLESDTSAARLGAGVAQAPRSSASGSDLPSWLSGVADDRASQDQAASSVPAAQPKDEFPDFLRDAGWGASTSRPETPSPFEEPTTAAPTEGAAIEGDLPEWVKALAPGDQGSTPSAPPPASSESGGLPSQDSPFATAFPADTPDWLRNLGEAEPPPTPAAPPPAPAAPTPTHLPADVPDWLRDLGPVTPSTPAPAGTPEQTPDWLKDLSGRELDEPAAPPPTPAHEADWLGDLRAEQAVAPQPPADESPDWLKEFSNDLETPIAKPEPPAPVSQPPVSAPAPAALGTLGTTAQEQDDAMAWLEGLAAKHGAKAEELVTDPNARTEVAPEWVDKAKEIVEPTPPAPTPPAPVPAEDETGTWLRGLEADMDTAAPQQPAEATSFDLRGSLADQNHFAGIEAEPQKEEEPPVSGEPEIPSWLNDFGAKPAERHGMEDAPDWLRGLSKEIEEPAEPPKPPAPTPPAPPPPAPRAPEPAEESTDLPAWLAGLDQEPSPMGPADVGVSPSDALPAWLQSEIEPAPEAREPAKPTDWHPVESKPVEPPPPVAESKPVVQQPAAPPPVQPPAPRPAVEEPITAPPPAPVARRAVEETPTVPPPPPAPEPVVERVPATAPAPTRPKPVAAAKPYAASLGDAQSQLGRGNIAAALDIYTKLIRKGKSLEDIIRDLRDALYRYPVEVPLWQSLGDAYMRANRLQEALDAYTKAEELLR